jgi:hypothetical protein
VVFPVFVLLGGDQGTAVSATPYTQITQAAFWIAAQQHKNWEHHTL